MKIGIPKERKQDETRVALRPVHVARLISMGHEVFVEIGAGERAGFSDDCYFNAGATLKGQADIYRLANLILKVKCPLESEYHFFGPGHILFTYLHFDENISPVNIMKIVNTHVTAIAYEFVEENGRFPLLEPMSELTGAVFARKAMSLLMEYQGLLGGQYLAYWPRTKVMVIGAGRIGCNAINVFARNNFDIVVIDKHPETLNKRLAGYISLEDLAKTKMDVIKFDENKHEESVAAIRRFLPMCDIVLCAAVRRATLPKSKCQYLIRREDVAAMKRNSILCDATACDYDLIETCASSSSLTKTYVEEGAVHYNCDHIPALVGNTATRLLSGATFPYICTLADGFDSAVPGNPALEAAVMCHQGNITHRKSALKKNLPFTALKDLYKSKHAYIK